MTALPRISGRYTSSSAGMAASAAPTRARHSLRLAVSSVPSRRLVAPYRLVSWRSSGQVH
jgi:hypothetical protein